MKVIGSSRSQEPFPFPQCTNSIGTRSTKYSTTRTFACHIMRNLLKYTCAKTYQYRSRFDKVIRKILWCSFFVHMVYCHYKKLSYGRDSARRRSLRSFKVNDVNTYSQLVNNTNLHLCLAPFSSDRGVLVKLSPLRRAPASR